MDDIRLYVLMRNDLSSLNSGKACAQSCHAANQCVFEGRVKNHDDDLIAILDEWEMQTECGFGTCIVLSGNIRDIETVVKNVNRVGLHAGMVHDPSYPILDGEIIHHIPLDTCAYVFGLFDEIAPFVKRLSLMP